MSSSRPQRTRFLRIFDFHAFAAAAIAACTSCSRPRVIAGRIGDELGRLQIVAREVRRITQSRGSSGTHLLGYLLASISNRWEPIKLASRLAVRIAYGGYTAEIQCFCGFPPLDRLGSPLLAKQVLLALILLIHCAYRL